MHLQHAMKSYVEIQTEKAKTQLSEVEEIRSTSGLHKIPSLENLQSIGSKVKRIVSRENLADAYSTSNKMKRS